MKVLLDKEGKKHFAFQSPFAALHCHVGFSEYLYAYRDEQLPAFFIPIDKPDSSAVEANRSGEDDAPSEETGKLPELDMKRPGDVLMNILQHLAYIIVSFEHLYIRLFPLHRRGLKDSLSAGDCRSNRDHFLRTIRGGEDQPRPAVGQVWNAIWAPDLTVPALHNLMQESRAFMINFQNIAQACENWALTTIRTVEFRFHEGSQDAVQIELFVMFCVAMVRAAERMACSAIRNGQGTAQGEGRKYGIQNDNADFEEEVERQYTLEDMFDLLQLDMIHRGYWRSRFEYFESDDVTMETGDNWKETYTDQWNEEDNDELGEFIREGPGEELGMWEEEQQREPSSEDAGSQTASEYAALMADLYGSGADDT